MRHHVAPRIEARQDLGLHERQARVVVVARGHELALRIELPLLCVLEHHQQQVEQLERDRVLRSLALERQQHAQVRVAAVSESSVGAGAQQAAGADERGRRTMLCLHALEQAVLAHEHPHLLGMRVRKGRDAPKALFDQRQRRLIELARVCEAIQHREEQRKQRARRRRERTVNAVLDLDREAVVARDQQRDQAQNGRHLLEVLQQPRVVLVHAAELLDAPVEERPCRPRERLVADAEPRDERLARNASRPGRQQHAVDVDRLDHQQQRRRVLAALLRADGLDREVLVKVRKLVERREHPEHVLRTLSARGHGRQRAHQRHEHHREALLRRLEEPPPRRVLKVLAPEQIAECRVSRVQQTEQIDHDRLLKVTRLDATKHEKAPIK